MNVNTDELEILARVNFSEPKFVDFLEKRLTIYSDAAILQQDEVALRWVQGRAQEVRDLLILLKNASETLRKAS